MSGEERMSNDDPIIGARRPLPRVAADGPLDPMLTELLRGAVELLPWSITDERNSEPVEGLYTYGHPLVDGTLMDRLPGLKVISNYGVGVDHINLADAAARGIPVGNTPGVLEATTADLAFALLLAAARRIVEGDRYARSTAFLRYDPGYMLGREVHGTTLGIVGLGRIGRLIARRALGFDMTVLYHNRRHRRDVEKELGVSYAPLDGLLAEADHVILSVPLTDETRGLMNRTRFRLMKPTATLVNVARGPVVEPAALFEALTERTIAAAALDVTDPEPLPRDHPLLRLENLVITPHLGSATVETRRKMAELSVANLLAGLRGDRLLHEVRPVAGATETSTDAPE
jgi:glyoxylate reductase